MLMVEQVAELRYENMATLSQDLYHSTAQQSLSTPQQLILIHTDIVETTVVLQFS